MIDDVKAEDAIRADVESHLKVRVSGVDCPSGIEVDPGRTFSCVVTTRSGDRARATLKIVDSDADVHFIGLRALK